jgi:hypothetical protein
MSINSDPTSRYMCNMDVVVREEDPEEGALLFNPDTGQVKVINTTGMFIWQLCHSAHTQDDMVQEVRNAFEGTPEGQVEADVAEFLAGMVENGFIGILEEER